MTSRFNATPLTTNIALIFLGAILIGLSHHLAREFDDFIIGYSETSLCALAVFLGASAIAILQPTNRYTLPIICVVGILCRLTLLTPEPHLSSDIYRYVWDGTMQHAGINPYRFVPGDPHLVNFRDDDIFPYINRRDYAPTIYPPVAQMVYYVGTALSSTLVTMKLTMYALEALSVHAMLQILRILGQPASRVILYAWSPLLIWEIGSSGHVDAAVVAALTLALLFRLRNQPIATGLALGAAVMIKFYPLLLLPALYKRARSGEPANWTMPAALLSVIVVGYSLYLSVGSKVLGFAGSYAQEEGMKSGSRYFLLDLAQHVPGLANLPVPIYIAFCGLCFAPLLVWSWRTSVEPGAAFLKPAAALAFTLMLLFSPHYPWYVIWLVPFVVLNNNFAIGMYVSAIFYGFTTQWADPGPKLYFLNKWIYGATAAAFALQLAYRHAPQLRSLTRSLLPAQTPQKLRNSEI